MAGVGSRTLLDAKYIDRRVSLTTCTEAVAVSEVGFIKFGSQVVTP